MTWEEIELTRLNCIICHKGVWTDDGIAICNACTLENHWSIEQVKSVWEIVNNSFPVNYAISCIMYITNNGTCHHDKPVMGHCVFTWCMNYRDKCAKHKSGQPLDLTPCK